MTLGYLHVGAPTHGVSRYGRMLAAAVRQQPGVEVVESELSLDTTAAFQPGLVGSAKRLAHCDLIHLQYNNLSAGCIWGAGWDQLAHLRSFVRAAGVPFVVTVHDIYQPDGFVSVALRRPVREIRRRWRARPRTATLRWLRRRAVRVLVCSREEQARISVHDRRITVIPLFVEPRAPGGTRESTKAALGLAGRRVVTLLGYIHERKGHALLIKALAELPEDVVAVFAGAPPQAANSIVPELLALAGSKNVHERVRITGYLPDDQLERYMMATDLAVCPFKRLSASASMTTWISMARPILASNLPQIREYNALEPDAILTFHPYTESALAAAIRNALHRDAGEQRQRVARLASRLALPAMVSRHIETYRQAISESSNGHRR